jgi:hypothetical protein
MGASGVGGRGVPSGDPASGKPGGPTGNPPLTNRGVFSTECGVRYVDYLSVTVWGSVEAVQNALESTYGDLLDEWGGWVPVGVGGRKKAIWPFVDGIAVIEYGDWADGFVSVEFKGTGCEAVGDDGLSEFREVLTESRLRSRASRVDVKFDGVGFTPWQAFRWGRRGWVNSRVVTPEECTHIRSESGETAYIGQRKKNRKDERIIRVYDRRGFVRCELESRGTYAAGLWDEMANTRLDRWPERFVAAMRGFCDFVDVPASWDGRNAQRLRLAPWWASFVGEAPRWSSRVRPFEVAQPPPLVDRVDGSTDRCSKHLLRLWYAFEAEGYSVSDFGDWLVKRCKSFALHRWDDADDATVKDIQRLFGSGVCGLPRGRGGSLPF